MLGYFRQASSNNNSQFGVAEPTKAIFTAEETQFLSPWQMYERVSTQPNTDPYGGWVAKSTQIGRWKEAKHPSLQSPIYNLRMTHDQSTLMIGTQETLSFYDLKNGMQKVKEFVPHNITWTISDMDISDDSKFALTSSLNKYVTLYDLEDYKVLTTFILSNNQNDVDEGYYGMRFFSCKMSADKCALIGGSGRLGQRALIQYFDITKNKVVHSIRAHDDDINTIGFVQREQSSVILSGSDDGLVKVWDIRTLGFSKTPVGILHGHTSGLTYVDSRNDSIYVCSNGKDHRLKVWDLRKMSPNRKNIKLSSYDYRYGRGAERYAQSNNSSEHHDDSLLTFKGHEVSRTLIRCHFSPKVTTNSEFIISASHDGYCYIFSLMDPEAKPIVVQKNVKISKQRSNSAQIESDDWEDVSNQQEIIPDSEEEDDYHERSSIIRDCIWSDSSIIVGDWQAKIREYFPCLK